MPPGRLQEAQGASRVDVEVVERPVLRQIVRRLGGAVDDQRGPLAADDGLDGLVIADVDVVMRESTRRPAQALEVPQRVAGMLRKPCSSS